MASGEKWTSSDQQALWKSLEDDLIHDLGRVPGKLHQLVLVLREMLYELSIGRFDTTARRRFWVRTMVLIGHRQDLVRRFFRCILRPRRYSTQPKKVFLFRRRIPPTEYSLISFVNDVRAVLNAEEFRRFMYILEDAQRDVYDGRYGVEQSRETLRRLTEVLRHYEVLLQKLSELSWNHLPGSAVEPLQTEHPYKLTLPQSASVSS